MDAGMYNAVISGNVSFFEETGGVALNLKKVTENGNSILHVAAKSGKVQIMEKVLNLQSSLLCMTNCRGHTALHIAASLGDFDMTKQLITFAEDQESRVKWLLLRTKNLEKNTALHDAVRHGHYDIVELLIKEDPGLASLTNNAGESPLFLAVDRGFYKVARCILEAVPECSYVGRNKMNVLHAAVIRAQRGKQFKARHILRNINHFLRAVVKLLKSKYEQAPKRGTTVVDFLGELLKSCPSAIAEVDEFGWIPLHYAAHFGNVEIVELFLKNDMSLVHIKDKTGMSALHISAKEGHVDVMKALIKNCPEICEFLDNKNRTALHLAAKSGKRNAVKILLTELAFGNLINEQDNEGNTPFHLAAIEGHYALLRMLVYERKIAWMTMNKEGMSIVDIIQSNKRLMSIEELQKRQIISMLNKADVGLSLERIVDRQTTKVQTLGTEGHGQLIEETERKQPAGIRAGMGAANNAEQNELKNIDGDRIVKETQQGIQTMADINFLVATIIASVTFAAIILVPGGYNDNGMATLSKNNEFKNFLAFNLFAFMLSLLSVFIYFCAAPVGVSKYNRPFYASALFCSTLTLGSLLFLATAFFWAIKAVWTERFTSLLWEGGKVFRFKSQFINADYKTNIIFSLFFVFFMIVYFIINRKLLNPYNIRALKEF